MNREETTTRIVTVDGSTLFVKETPEEILKLIEEAGLPKVTFYNNNVDFSKQKHNSRVQEIIDQAHAAEILMQEKDPTYGR